jgi:hypothetical protein
MNPESGVVVARTRKRTWVLLGLGGVILAFILWSALGGPGAGSVPLPESPPLPVPNGYDEVLEAARVIEQSGTTGAKLDLTNADEAVLAPVVAANREALARARKGLDASFQVPVVYHMDYVMNVLMRDLGSIRAGVARGLTAEGRLALAQGRTDDSVRSFVDLVRLGDAISHRVPMIAYLVSVAVQSTGLHNLRDFRAKLSVEQCRRVIELLEETDQKRERAAQVALCETRFMNANVRKMGLIAGISMKLTGLQAKEVAKATSMLEATERRQNAARRLLLADLAIRVYRQEHGEDPPDLSALVPSILKSVPIDPYSDQPLRYQKRGNDGIVYSLGPDRDDDKLSKPLPQKHVDTTDGDYTIDSF